MCGRIIKTVLKGRSVMYKHWPSICAILDSNLRLALVAIDPESEEGKRLASAFPECFSAEAYEGPIPFSIFLRNVEAERASDPVQGTLAAEHVCEKLAIPFVRYAMSEQTFKESGDGFYAGRVTRSWLQSNPHKIGDVVTLDGNEYVVLDNTYNELTLASTKRVSGATAA